MRDLDGNIDCTRDSNNDAYDESEAYMEGRVTDKQYHTVNDLDAEEAAIRRSYARYLDVESVDVVHGDETFRRIVVRLTGHDIIHDLYKV